MISFTIGTDTLAEDVTISDIENYISVAANALSPFDYEIRRSLHQVSKETIFAIINTTSDLVTQMATTHTPEEISYTRRVLDAMFETYNTRRKEIMGVTSLQAFEKAVLKGSGDRQSGMGEGDASTQAAVDKGLSRHEAEDTLKRLVSEGWFERSIEGWYTLTPRALMELQSWLVDTYNDTEEPDGWQRIKTCQACRYIVTVGQRCAKLECNVRLHDICHMAYWHSRPNEKCPKCETEWDGRHWVGQKVVTTTEEYLRKTGGRNGQSRNSQGRNSLGQALEDEQVEEDEDMEAEDDDE